MGGVSGPNRSDPFARLRCRRAWRGPQVDETAWADDWALRPCGIGSLRGWGAGRAEHRRRATTMVQGGTVQLGLSISSEEHDPNELIRLAAAAEESGFTTAWVSDHFHPWISRQGNASFVWSVLGGIDGVTRDLQVGTGVTCPIGRMHPAIVAHASATVAAMMPGRFFLGLGSGEPRPRSSPVVSQMDTSLRPRSRTWSRASKTREEGRSLAWANSRYVSPPTRPMRAASRTSSFGSSQRSCSRNSQRARFEHADQSGRGPGGIPPWGYPNRHG